MPGASQFVCHRCIDCSCLIVSHRSVEGRIPKHFLYIFHLFQHALGLARVFFANISSNLKALFRTNDKLGHSIMILRHTSLEDHKAGPEKQTLNLVSWLLLRSGLFYQFVTIASVEAEVNI